jgi:protein-S-isoprenylcysteine O-methyltransferase Ste14
MRNWQLPSKKIKMQKIRTILSLLLLLLTTIYVQAQEGSANTAFGETMRSSGRIYVVIAVILTILFGLILYLVRLDKKMSKLEKEQ